MIFASRQVAPIFWRFFTAATFALPWRLLGVAQIHVQAHESPAARLYTRAMPFPAPSTRPNATPSPSQRLAAWHDRFALAAPLVSVALFLVAIAAALWYLHTEEVARERETLKRNVEYAQQRVRLRLLDRQEVLMRLARAVTLEGTNPQQFQQRAEALLAQSPDLLSLTWINNQRSILAAAAAPLMPTSQQRRQGEQLAPGDTDSGFSLARDLMQPVYVQPTANALGRANRARMQWLDDGDARDNAATEMQRDIPFTGSEIDTVTGIVDERFGRYRVQLARAPMINSVATPPAAPAREGDLRIAAMNLENLFNGDGNGGGFPTERGAKTQAAYQHQRAKLVAALAALDADVVALMELENDTTGPLSSEAQLLAALNAAHGGDWRAVRMPANANTDAIRVGMIYRATKVQPVGRAATFDQGPFAALSRPPLLQSFRADRGPEFSVVANHFKSKGCRGAKGADADQRDGQSCWNASRLDSAQLLDRWLRQRLGATLGVPVAILGDLNAYALEDPPRWLRKNGWRDAFTEAGIAHPYSYVYDGQIGRLDHALITPAMARQLVSAAEWHINADAPDAPQRPDAPVTPYRSSDHDPIVIDLRLPGR